jgi:repressor LexA
MYSQDRYKSLVNFIYNYTQKNGFPPSVREIGDAIGVSSSSTIHKFIKKSVEEGYVELHPKIARSIRVSEYGKKLLKTS